MLFLGCLNALCVQLPYHALKQSNLAFKEYSFFEWYMGICVYRYVSGFSLLDCVDLDIIVGPLYYKEVDFDVDFGHPVLPILVFYFIFFYWSHKSPFLAFTMSICSRQLFDVVDFLYFEAKQDGYRHF